ncbi:MAG: hypothetical protein KBD65_03095 [Candidatus Moranbacteria bacterium]|nr:hypothetical protein [Candidatus Moranbacteria bacterium]
MNKEEAEVYMSLSNDPNERGRLWKLHMLSGKTGLLKKMQDRYDELFLKIAKETLSKNYESN